MGRSLQRPGSVRTLVPGTSPIQVLGKRNTARSRIISNVGIDPIYVGYSSALSPGDGFTVLPGQSLITDQPVSLFVMGSSSTSIVSVLEES